MALTSLLRTAADNENPASLANSLRRKRFAFFHALLEQVPAPVKLLDVGGTPQFWRHMNTLPSASLRITLLNLEGVTADSMGFTVHAGDARNLSRYDDQSFDIVFSNSVIEHVGRVSDQAAMAREVLRVGKRYFVQTPNRYFPLEPHFLFPFFQFLPETLQVFLLTRRDLGWYERVSDREVARTLVQSVRLMNEREFRALFPGGKIYREKFLALTKSLVAYGGWE